MHAHSSYRAQKSEALATRSSQSFRYRERERGGEEETGRRLLRIFPKNSLVDPFNSETDHTCRLQKAVVVQAAHHQPPHVEVRRALFNLEARDRFAVQGFDETLQAIHGFLLIKR